MYNICYIGRMCNIDRQMDLEHKYVAMSKHRTWLSICMFL